jgi:hypothetical protein
MEPQPTQLSVRYILIMSTCILNDQESSLFPSQNTVYTYRLPKVCRVYWASTCSNTHTDRVFWFQITVDVPPQ